MPAFRTFDRLGAMLPWSGNAACNVIEGPAMTTQTARNAHMTWAPRIALPRLSAWAEYYIILATMVVALCGGAAVALHALSVSSTF
jgi:hypothetical protein